MESQEEITRLIESYLEGELSPEQRQAFETRCEQESEFEEAVRLHIKASYAVRSYVRDQRKEQFNQLFDELDIQPMNFWSKYRNPLLAVAAVVILATLSILFWPRPTQSPTALFASAWEEELNHTPLQMPVERVRTQSLIDSLQQNGKRLWVDAALAFNQQEHEKSIMLIQRALEDTSFKNTSTAWFYLGLNHMILSDSIHQSDAELKETLSQSYLNQAIRHFEQVSANSSYIEQAMWFKALAYLKANQVGSARQMLEEVLAYEKHYRRAEAQKLLKQLPLTSSD